jgi:hypothetical protein
VEKSGSLTASWGNSPGLGFAGLGGPEFIPGSFFVSADLGQPIPQILFIVSAHLSRRYQ